MVKSVSEIMTVKIETIGLEETAQMAAKRMKDKNVSSLVVVDRNDQAIGIVTERDLVREVCIQDASSSEFIIQHIMSSPIVTIDPNSSIETADQCYATEQGKTSSSRKWIEDGRNNYFKQLYQLFEWTTRLKRCKCEDTCSTIRRTN